MHGSGFKPPTRYASFVDGRSFSSPGMRDGYDSMRRSHDSMMRPWAVVTVTSP
jgi:hypothetical protein